MMNNTPNGIQVGTECGDLNREIKKCMEQYIAGDTKMMGKIFKLVRRREQLLKSTHGESK